MALFRNLRLRNCILTQIFKSKIYNLKLERINQTNHIPVDIVDNIDSGDNIDTEDSIDTENNIDIIYQEF
jgi:hypothetical protein